MGEELVKTPKKSLQEIFEEQCPYYLMFGMTAEQYWDGDCLLVKYYREKDKLEQERINEQLWLQGLYVYDALVRVAPYLRAFKPKEPDKYVAKPYPRTTESIKKEKLQEVQDIKDMQKAKLMGWAEKVNASKRKKNGTES